MSKEVYVYVAGPYSWPDPVENTHHAVEVADQLVRLGYTPYLPHASLIWHLVKPHPVDYWYALDLLWLQKCDVVLRMPGKSPGADAEVAMATKLGIEVVYSVQELQDKFKFAMKLDDNWRAR